MKIKIIINSKSGRAKKGNELEKLTSVLKKFPDVEPYFLKKGEDPQSIAARLAKEGAEIVGAAGGDGTVSAVANGLARTDTALAVIPFGTLNHFARDLKLPAKLEEAVEGVLGEKAINRKIDLGQVNGRYFINNSSLGLYPHLVLLREENESRLGKWPALGLAFINTLRYPVYIPIRIPDSEDQIPQKVWLVFTSNNLINLSLAQPGIRDKLNENLLDRYILKASNPLTLLGTIPAFVTGRLEKSSLVIEEHRTEFEVSVKKNHRVTVACDGEIFRMNSPICYKVVPEALTLRVPPMKIKSEVPVKNGVQGEI